MTVSVTFKPSALNYSDLFQLGAEVRYPRSSHPILTWILRETLCIVLFGSFLIYVVEFLNFEIRTFVLVVIPALLLTWTMYLVARLRWTYWAYRSAQTFVVELSEDGVSLRDGNSAWQSRWKPNFDILVTPQFVLILCGKPTTIWIPRRSFASIEVEDEFVRVGRLLQAAATGETKTLFFIEEPSTSPPATGQ